MHIIIIGSGIAGITFAEKYRELSPESKITLLTRDTNGYYSRPLLSHGFSKENIEHSIILKPFEQLLENNICIISGVDVTEIDREQHSVSVSGSDGPETLTYDKLILAQGSAAFIPPPFIPYQEHFFLLNSLDDLIKLRRFRQAYLDNHKKPHWAIIGGGLIGCEMASDLEISGDQVTLFHAMDRLMERQLVEEDSAILLDVLTSSGVRVLLNQSVQGFAQQHGKRCVNTVKHSEQYRYDGIIVSCGFKPRTEIAAAAGLEISRGIKVNQFLKTSDDNIHALGDVAELPNGKLYAFILPIRHQALWLAGYLAGESDQPWIAPAFKPKAKVHGFMATNPYLF